MLAPSGKPTFQALLSFLKKTGYFSQLYNNKESGEFCSYVYGPLGTQMKHNVLQEWWKAVVTSEEENIFGVSSPLATWNTKCVLENSTSSQDVVPTGEDVPPVRSSVAAGSLHHYPHVLQLVGGRVPFGIAQWGACIKRSNDKERVHEEGNVSQLLPLERTEMSVQFFASPSSSLQCFDSWHRKRLLWWRRFSGTPSCFSMTEVESSKGHASVQIQHSSPWGSTVVETISNKGSTPLENLSKELEVSCQAKDGRKSILPHVIECTTYLEMSVLRYLLDSYQEKIRQNSLKTILQLHHKLAPFKISIAISGTASNQLQDVAIYLSRETRRVGLSVFNVGDRMHSALEQQFIRSDEMGIPYCIILNDSTLKNGILVFRSRDTTLKEQVHISDAKTRLLKHLQ